MKSVVLSGHNNVAVHSTPKKHNSNPDKPKPTNFDVFVPWICNEWKCPQSIVVIRTQEFVHLHHQATHKETRKVSSSKSNKSSASRKSSTSERKVSLKLDDPNIVIIHTFYNIQGKLIEVNLTNIGIIDGKIIHAISLCIPFHSTLTTLKFKKECVDTVLLGQISKMIPHSNLTEICLDGCSLIKGNYYVLLEEISQLKYLSLNRCSIDDEVCAILASRLAFGTAGSSLLALDIASNLIGDDGAEKIGKILRQNRTLLHLNLSGNYITDDGAKFIFEALTEFCLTEDEILESRQRKYKYFENNIAVYNKCFIEIRERQAKEYAIRATGSKKSLNKGKKQKRFAASSLAKDTLVAAENAEEMAVDIVGHFYDPFSKDNIHTIDNLTYTQGNMVLCSLNLAYNNLEYFSVRKIFEVLLYQREIQKPPNCKGLSRVRFEGNYVPNNCEEYAYIDDMLKLNLNFQQPNKTHSGKPKKRSPKVNQIKENKNQQN